MLEESQSAHDRGQFRFGRCLVDSQGFGSRKRGQSECIALRNQIWPFEILVHDVSLSWTPLVFVHGFPAKTPTTGRSSGVRTGYRTRTHSVLFERAVTTSTLAAVAAPGEEMGGEDAHTGDRVPVGISPGSNGFVVPVDDEGALGIRGVQSVGQRHFESVLAEGSRLQQRNGLTYGS